MKSVCVVAVYTIYVDATLVLARYARVCACVQLLVIVQNKTIKEIKIELYFHAPSCQRCLNKGSALFFACVIFSVLTTHMPLMDLVCKLKSSQGYMSATSQLRHFMLKPQPNFRIKRQNFPKSRIKHHAAEAHGLVEVGLHSFLTSALVIGHFPSEIHLPCQLATGVGG